MRISLLQCRVGDRGKIIALETTDRKILGKLMSLGIIPGTPVALLRRSPGFLLQVGHTKIALDRSLSMVIWVEVENRQACRKIF